MRASLERSLNRTWYGTRQPGAVLLLLERVYGALSSLHRGYNHLRRARDLQDSPIVIVGNLTAGGAGKTPLVIALCEIARSSGLRPGVISRGYGRRTRQALSVTADMDPRDSGDEPYLIAKRCQVPVAVDTQRERAARKLLETGVNLIIADDGLQRTRLPRILEICVVDQSREFGNGHLLPAGPLREPVTRLESIDFVVEHKPSGARMMPDEGYSMQLKPGDLVKLHGGEARALTSITSEESPVHAVAGIASPGRFFDMLEAAGIKTTRHPFPDHHRFRQSDFSDIPADSMILMTEKDAVKCRNLALNNAWYLPVEAVLSESLDNALTTALGSIANKNGSR